MQKNNISIKRITLNDKNNLQGLELLQDISANENEIYSSPVPKEINDEGLLKSINLTKEDLYLGFLKLAEDDAKEGKNFKYWILNLDDIIGYSDIKIDGNTGDIGIILSTTSRGKNIGLEAMKILLKEAKENLKLDNITITTSNKNIPMQKLCEKLGGNLISSDDNFKYNVN